VFSFVEACLLLNALNALDRQVRQILAVDWLNCNLTCH